MSGIDQAKAVGARIKARRKALGLTQMSLGGPLGVSARAVGFWESGETLPTLDKMAELAVVLECTPDDLLIEPAPPGVPDPASMPAIPFHALADLFPLLTGAEFDAMVDDMKANGFRAGEEIVLFEGRILDGRNRCRAAIAAGIFPRDVSLNNPRNIDPKTEWLFCEFGSDGLFTAAEVAAGPLAYVISRNIHRRHLTTSQRAMIAARIATMDRGRPEKKPSNDGITTAQAAKAFKVGTASVERARKVIDQAAPEVAAAVTAGAMSVAAAETIAELPAERQRAIIEAADPKVLRQVIGEQRAKTNAEKKQRRNDREARLADKVVALPGRKFSVFYFDPPWQFDPRSRETGMDRAADNHYPTLPLSEIQRWNIADIVAPDAIAFLWATVPMLIEAICTLDAFGFLCLERDQDGYLTPDKSAAKYVSGLVWLKNRMANGYWLRNCHEHLLIATRGNPPCPAMGTQSRSAIEAPVGRHSAKPDDFARIIEGYFPNLPKIEFNARAARPGWTCVIHDPDAGQRVVGPDGEDISP